MPDCRLTPCARFSLATHGDPARGESIQQLRIGQGSRRAVKVQVRQVSRCRSGGFADHDLRVLETSPSVAQFPM